MSEIEHHRGIATKVYQGLGETLEQTAKKILDRRNITVPSYFNNALEYLCDDLYEEYFFHHNSQSLFKIEDTEIENEEEVIRAKEIGKDKFEYELKFHNGGAGFTECLKEAFDKL